MNDTGPILDWIKQLLAGLWAMLLDVYHQAAALLAGAEARLGRLESRLEWAFWLLLGMLALHALVGAWSRRK